MAVSRLWLRSTCCTEVQYCRIVEPLESMKWHRDVATAACISCADCRCSGARPGFLVECRVHGRRDTATLCFASSWNRRYSTVQYSSCRPILFPAADVDRHLLRPPVSGLCVRDRNGGSETGCGAPGQFLVLRQRQQKTESVLARSWVSTFTV